MVFQKGTRRLLEAGRIDTKIVHIMSISRTRPESGGRVNGYKMDREMGKERSIRNRIP